MINPAEVGNRVFGQPHMCARKGPQRMICELEPGHGGDHQMMGIYGFWRSWIEDDTPERPTLF